MKETGAKEFRFRDAFILGVLALALVWLGIFAADHLIDNVGQIRIVDAAGQPVAGAHLLVFRDTFDNGYDLTSNGQGEFSSRLKGGQYGLMLFADGDCCPMYIGTLKVGLTQQFAGGSIVDAVANDPRIAVIGKKVVVTLVDLLAPCEDCQPVPTPTAMPVGFPTPTPIRRPTEAVAMPTSMATNNEPPVPTPPTQLADMAS